MLTLKGKVMYRCQSILVMTPYCFWLILEYPVSRLVMIITHSMGLAYEILHGPLFQSINICNGPGWLSDLPTYLPTYLPIFTYILTPGFICQSQSDGRVWVIQPTSTSTEPLGSTRPAKRRGNRLHLTALLDSLSRLLQRIVCSTNLRMT